MEETKKLFRSGSDSMIAGVCGGLANYFKIDSSLVRIIFVLLTLGGGSGVLLYLILWLVVPQKETKDKEKPMIKEVKMEKVSKKRVSVLGIILVLIGAVAIWNQLSPIVIDWNYFWPAMLILMGISLLIK